MHLPDIYEFYDYRALLENFIKLNQSERGIKSKLADAAGCSRSYFSQMLAGHAELTPDHAAGISEFWHLSDAETEFFLDVIHYTRAGTPKLRAILKKRLEAQKKKNINLKKVIKSTETQDQSVKAQYYSSWIYPTIHVLTSIPQFKTPVAIAARLNLSIDVVIKALSFLQASGLVIKNEKGYDIRFDNIHIPNDSPFSTINHTNFRMMATQSIQMNRVENIHYTGVHSLSKMDYSILKKEIIEFIGKTREKVAPSKEEELVFFLCDFFTL